MKRISTLAVAALLAVSMSAFADNTTTKPSCDTKSAAECQKKNADCTKKCTGDNHSCAKHDAKSCNKSSDKK